MNNMIFVFGSNTAGIHGAGAALLANEKYGAQLGVGFGMRGQSFAIPTKDKFIQTLPLEEIAEFVELFIKYAEDYDFLKFKVTQIGCGLAGYTPKEIAPLFKDAPKNCYFDIAWRPYLGDEFNYWGTHP